MSKPRTVYVALLGVGGVGRAFLFQLSHLIKRLELSSVPTSLHLIYIATSRKSLFSQDYSPLLHPTINESWKPEEYSEAILSALPNSPTQPLDLEHDLEKYVVDAPGPVIFVDNTSEQKIADLYASLLSKGINIVTPNKKAFSGTTASWNAIKHALETGPRSYLFHEATAGAGLPLLSSLTELARTGDNVLRIEGVFSGTMSFLFNSFSPANATSPSTDPAWSEILRTAVKEGYTEPDPRDDLSGKDVARKLTILARTVFDLPVELESIPVQGLVPEELKECQSGMEFLERLPEFDEKMKQMRDNAVEEGKVLRYVGVLDIAKRELRVGLEEYDKMHPIAQLTGSQKSISIHTERYGDSALILQGGSAAVELTAMTITGDLIKVLDRVV